ncbi:MAG: chromate transporter [Acidobacteria bacterium]|nr:chromate transporter [Acidobacteriota bacterium]
MIGFLDFYLVKKAPFQIPDGAREWLVKYGPWISIVLLVILLPPLLVVLGIGTLFVPFAGLNYATGWGLAVIALLVQVALLVMALPGLFKRKMSAWRLLFYSQLVGIVHSLLSGSLVGAVVGGLIGLYILFQIRPLYHE